MNYKLTKEQEDMLDEFDRMLAEAPTPVAEEEVLLSHDELVRGMGIEALLFNLHEAKKQSEVYRGLTDGSMEACYDSYLGFHLERELSRRNVPFEPQRFR